VSVSTPPPTASTTWVSGTDSELSRSPSPPTTGGPDPAAGHTDRVSFGVYVHIPFCARRCDYCAFATWTDRAHLVDAYLDALRADIGRAVVAGEVPEATSVFFGGGTPSLVSAAGLMAVLAEIPRVPGAEVTVECNPDTVDPALLDAYVAGGVDRISLGVQSMVPSVLAALGRSHDPESVARAVDSARSAGLRSFNLDLIYGGAGETVAEWERTVDAAIALEPPHVSAYALTVEAGTPLAADEARHPDDDDQADKYLLAEERLSAAGLESYEISNWARPGHRCRHNELYWEQGDYRGFGCAAHSHRDGRRWWNVRTPERYVDAVVEGRPTEAAGEDLEPDRRRVEGLQLSLRTAGGVPVDALAPDDRELLAGLLVERDGRLCLTVEGRLLANEVAVRLR
jgi:putative oxygen-independent coproporphyrinogen III oxidase